jgi:glycosyltransferase involved in cell wall biosynthesis
MTGEKSGIKGKVCLWPHLSGVGGPASFYLKMQEGLKKRGIPIASHPLEEGCQVVLIIGGSSRVIDLWRARQRGVRIIQRLNGMNWVHRRCFTGVKHFLLSERNNLLLSGIRKWLADGIVYQSRFSQTWWNEVYGAINASESVVYNGVDVNHFVPGTPDQLPTEFIRLLLVEGHLGGGHEYGLKIGYQLGKGIQNQMQKQVEVLILGDVPAMEQIKWISQQQDVAMKFMGVVPRKDILGIDQSSHVMYTAELNAACPNSVIEALAAGLPVVGYETGSIPELLGEEGGIYVPYGGNHWKLEQPDIPHLTAAAVQVIENSARYRQSARKRAEQLFNVDLMVEKYLNAMRV